MASLVTWRIVVSPPPSLDPCSRFSIPFHPRIITRVEYRGIDLSGDRERTWTRGRKFSFSFSFSFVSFSPLGRSTFVRPFFFLFFPPPRARLKSKPGNSRQIYTRRRVIEYCGRTIFSSRPWFKFNSRLHFGNLGSSNRKFFNRKSYRNRRLIFLSRYFAEGISPLLSSSRRRGRQLILPYHLTEFF